MTAAASPVGSKAFRVVLAGLLVVTILIAWIHHFQTSTITLTRGAADAIVDDVVERYRTKLIDAGVPQANTLRWHYLREQFVIVSVISREAAGTTMARVRIASKLLPNASPPPVMCFNLTSRGDDAWDVSLLPSPVAFWLR